MQIEFYKPEDIKFRLIGYEKCSKTTITFLNDTYNEDTYNYRLNEMKNNVKIHKITKLKNEIEEIILER